MGAAPHGLILPHPGVELVKPVVFQPVDRKTAGSDIFSRLVPMSAYEASSVYRYAILVPAGEHLLPSHHILIMSVLIGQFKREFLSVNNY